MDGGKGKDSQATEVWHRAFPPPPYWLFFYVFQSSKDEYNGNPLKGAEILSISREQLGINLVESWPCLLAPNVGHICTADKHVSFYFNLVLVPFT